MPTHVTGVLEAIEEIGIELQLIGDRSHLDANFEVTLQKLRRWKRRACELMREKVSIEEGDAFKNVRETIIPPEPERAITMTVESYSAFLDALHSEIKEHPETITRQQEKERLTKGIEKIISSLESRNPSNSRQPANSVVMSANSKKIFIVHGHDEANLFRIRDMLKERFNLQPIILSAKAGKGRTIIEKFEEEAKEAAFAFVLLTPDDAIKSGTREYTQARPNVIFELGWFYGRLGRKNVCILFKKGTQIHSDLEGIERIEFNNHVDEAYLAIERELKGGGII